MEGKSDISSGGHFSSPAKRCEQNVCVTPLSSSMKAACVGKVSVSHLFPPSLPPSLLPCLCPVFRVSGFRASLSEEKHQGVDERVAAAWEELPTEVKRGFWGMLFTRAKSNS